MLAEGLKEFSISSIFNIKVVFHLSTHKNKSHFLSFFEQKKNVGNFWAMKNDLINFIYRCIFSYYSVLLHARLKTILAPA